MIKPNVKGNLRFNDEIDSEVILLVEKLGRVFLKPEIHTRDSIFHELQEGENLVEIDKRGDTSVCGIFEEKTAKFHPINMLKVADAVIYMGKEKAGLLEEHLVEQFEYRKKVCKPCLDNGSCLTCGCKTPDRMYSRSACAAKKYPKLMEKDAWEEFKDKRAVMDSEMKT